MWPVWQSIHTKYLEKSYRVLSHTVQSHTCYEVTPQPPTALTASGTLLIFASLLALYLAKCVHATSILCYEIFLLRSHTAISYGYDCIGDAVDLCLSLAPYLAKCVHATSILCYEMIFLLRSHTAISYGIGLWLHRGHCWSLPLFLLHTLPNASMQPQFSALRWSSSSCLCNNPCFSDAHRHGWCWNSLLWDDLPFVVSVMFPVLVIPIATWSMLYLYWNHGRVSVSNGEEAIYEFQHQPWRWASLNQGTESKP